MEPCATTLIAPSPAEDQGSDSVRRKTIDSLAWIALMHLARGLLFFAVPAVLANVAGAHDIGSAEIGLAIFSIATLFIELGTGPAIIRKPELDQGFLSTVFYINIATGVLFGGLLYWGAGPLTTVLHLGRPAAGYLRWIAPSFVLLSLAIVQRSLLARRMAFKTLSLINVAAVIGGLLIAWVGYATGHGAAALIAGAIGFAAITCAGLWATGRWLPSVRFDRRQVIPLFRFSLSVSASSALDNLSAQWERFLIAGLLGPADLGCYSLARHIHRTPLRHLMQVTDTVLFPGLSMIQSDKAKCRSYYLAALRHELALLGPILALLMIFMPDLVPLIYGKGWGNLLPLTYLTIPVTLRMVTAHTVGAVFLSQGRSDVQLKWVTLSVVLMTAYTLTGSPWGIQGVAVAVLVLGCASWVVSHLMANRLIQLGFRDFLKNLAVPVLASLILGLVIWPLAEILRIWGPGTAFRLGIGFAAGVLVHVLILHFLDPVLLASIRRSIKGAFRV